MPLDPAACMVALAYSMSVVDMALILGLVDTPELAVAAAQAVLRARHRGDAAGLGRGAAAGAARGGGLCTAVGAGPGRPQGRGRWWVRRGGRGLSAEPGLWLATAVSALIFTAGALAMISLLAWSLAWRWPWPGLLPESWSLRAWATPGSGWAEALGKHGGFLPRPPPPCRLRWPSPGWKGRTAPGAARAGWAEALIYLPLLVPQIGFLFGLNVLFLHLGLTGGYAAVIWAQALFVFSLRD